MRGGIWAAAAVASLIFAPAPAGAALAGDQLAARGTAERALRAGPGDRARGERRHPHRHAARRRLGRPRRHGPCANQPRRRLRNPELRRHGGLVHPRRSRALRHGQAAGKTTSGASSPAPGSTLRTAGRRLGAPAATPGAGVTVAILDSGVAYRERGRRFARDPDLAASSFVHPRDFVDGDRAPLDENGHGTHVAAAIGEATDNSRGLAGLAYGARLMPVRVLDGALHGSAITISRGIRFAARNGADVINLSLTFGPGVRRCSQIPDVCRRDQGGHAAGRPRRGGGRQLGRRCAGAACGDAEGARGRRDHGARLPRRLLQPRRRPRRAGRGHRRELAAATRVATPRRRRGGSASSRSTPARPLPGTTGASATSSFRGPRRRRRRHRRRPRSSSRAAFRCRGPAPSASPSGSSAPPPRRGTRRTTGVTDGSTPRARSTRPRSAEPTRPLTWSGRCRRRRGRDGRPCSARCRAGSASRRSSPCCRPR